MLIDVEGTIDANTLFLRTPQFLRTAWFLQTFWFLHLFCFYTLVELDDPRQQIFKGRTKKSTPVLRVTAIS